MTTPTPKRDRWFASMFSALAWSMLLALAFIFIAYNEFQANRSVGWLPLVIP